MSTQISPEKVQQIVEQYFAATQVVDAQQKVEQMLACFAPDCLCHDPAEGPGISGPAELRQFFQTIIDLFAEVSLETTFISVNGEQAAAYWQGQGVGKNGQPVTFTGIDVFSINPEGKIQTMQGYWNPAAVAAKLMPPA